MTHRPSVWCSKHYFFIIFQKKRRCLSALSLSPIMLGTSDAWSMSHLSHWPSNPEYCIEDCQIVRLALCICCVKMDLTTMWGGLPPLLASCPFSPKSIKIEIEEKNFDTLTLIFHAQKKNPSSQTSIWSLSFRPTVPSWFSDIKFSDNLWFSNYFPNTIFSIYHIILSWFINGWWHWNWPALHHTAGLDNIFVQIYMDVLPGVPGVS